MSLPQAATISQQQFDRYTAEWLRTLSAARPEALRRSLQPTDAAASRLLSVTVSYQELLWLVSSVGATHIETRFLLLPDAADAAADKQFTVALYAVDARGVRVSAFYLAQAEAPVGSSAQTATAASADGPQQVPHYVVWSWLNNWKTQPVISADWFATSYGPLQGYKFTLDDFKQPLFNAPSLDHQLPLYQLRISFGLHEYYPASAGDSPTLAHTFGLVLRLNKLPTTGEDIVVESGDPFYDMSTPCPPGH